MAEVYGPLVIDILDAIKALFVASEQTYLGAVEEDNIFIGRPQGGGEFFPLIIIKPVEDNLEDTDFRRQVSDLDIVVGAAVKGDDPVVELQNVLHLGGDMYDILMDKDNRKITAASRISLIRNVKWGDEANDENEVLHWVIMILKVEAKHYVD